MASATVRSKNCLAAYILLRLRTSRSDREKNDEQQRSATAIYKIFPTHSSFIIKMRSPEKFAQGFTPIMATISLKKHL
jgi:hypothetical protein